MTEEEKFILLLLFLVLLVSRNSKGQTSGQVVFRNPEPKTPRPPAPPPTRRPKLIVNNNELVAVNLEKGQRYRISTMGNADIDIKVKE